MIRWKLRAPAGENILSGCAMEHIVDKNKIIKRLSITSGINGCSIVLFAGLCLLVCLFTKSWQGMIICLAIAASGGMELTGRTRLIDRHPDAQKWLVASQLWLMGILICYALYKLISFDPSGISVLMSPELQSLIESRLNLTSTALTEMVIRIYNAVYITLIAVTTLYQGILCLYYWKSTEKVFSHPRPFPIREKSA